MQMRQINKVGVHHGRLPESRFTVCCFNNEVKTILYLTLLLNAPLKKPICPFLLLEIPITENKKTTKNNRGRGCNKNTFGSVRGCEEVE